VQQPQGEVVAGVTVHHVVRHERARPAGHAVDDADTAPGQPRIDAEHPHADPPPPLYVCSTP
jgi:hypothetical protein